MSVHMRTGCDAIAIKRLRVRQLLPLMLGFLSDFLRLLRGPESATPLLVHLRARRDTVNGHEEQLLWLDFTKEMVDIGENGGENLLFS